MGGPISKWDKANDDDYDYFTFALTFKRKLGR